MNRKVVFNLPSTGGGVLVKGYDRLLPQKVAEAIGELGNAVLRSGAETKLRSALQEYGVKISKDVLCNILVENNGLTRAEAESIASSALRE